MAAEPAHVPLGESGETCDRLVDPRELARAERPAKVVEPAVEAEPLVLEEAADLSLSKGRQIIDEQGERMFK